MKTPFVFGKIVFIPPGRVHAIGKGILLAEIQQSSDITYRIHDYNRLDKDGRLRPLHIKEAQEVVVLEAVQQPIINYKSTYVNRENDLN